MKKLVAGCLTLLLLAAGGAFASSGSVSTDPVNQAPVDEVYSELDEAHALLVKDQTGWSDANTDILNQMPDVTYDQINSSSLAGTDFSEYTFVIICGGQSDAFNSNVNAAMDELGAYVEDGGWLQVHMGTNAHSPDIMLWDGTACIDGTYYESDNYMGPDGDDHPLLDDMQEPYSGNYANHGYIGGYSDDALIIVETSTSQPTCIEYDHGQGKVIASTTPLEHAWGNDLVIGQLLWNMMEYCADAPPPGPVQFTLVPQTTVIPPDGGDVVYGVELISTLPQTVPGLAYWTIVTIPNGQEFGPLTVQPFTHTPNMQVSIQNIAQYIPALAPTGTYTFTGHIGFQPNSLLDDDFDFEKLGAATAPGEGVMPTQWPEQTLLKDADVRQLK